MRTVWVASAVPEARTVRGAKSVRTVPTVGRWSRGPGWHPVFEGEAHIATDPYDLQRFLEAQRGAYERACAELREGCKRSHWMWFVFPQLEGLGTSAMARRYAIRSLDEARAYLAHPVLGPRLRECTQLVNAVQRVTIDAILGHPDDLKFRSSMTLFARATPDNGEFLEALRRYFGGSSDPATLARLGAGASVPHGRDPG